MLSRVAGFISSVENVLLGVIGTVTTYAVKSMTVNTFKHHQNLAILYPEYYSANRLAFLSNPASEAEVRAYGNKQIAISTAYLALGCTAFVISRLKTKYCENQVTNETNQASLPQQLDKTAINLHLTEAEVISINTLASELYDVENKLREQIKFKASSPEYSEFKNYHKAAKSLQRKRKTLLELSQKRAASSDDIQRKEFLTNQYVTLLSNHKCRMQKLLDKLVDIESVIEDKEESEIRVLEPRLIQVMPR